MYGLHGHLEPGPSEMFVVGKYQPLPAAAAQGSHVHGGPKGGDLKVGPGGRASHVGR